ncbi:MAG: hypothetical protein JKY52_13960 [Flavobacteriales bacterium]|nr:hypothetical protein [Flavobacteriales bacterium]
MLDTHDQGSLEHWNNYNNKFDNKHGVYSNGGTFGLIFLLVILMGMGFYIGSFYWDREPIPEATRKHRITEAIQFDYHNSTMASNKKVA